MAENLPAEIEALRPKLQKAFTLSWDAVLAAIIEAFAAGKAVGKAEASSELKTRLSNLLELRDEAPAPASPISATAMLTTSTKRAPRGSIKPTVIGALLDYGQPGLKPVEIAIRTALNENSVRGALNALAHEGITTKQGDLWVLADQK